MPDWRHTELDAVASIILVFFWLWTVPIAAVSVTNFHDWNVIQVSSRTQLWWSGGETQTVGGSMVGDTFCSTQLSVTHLGMTFSRNDNHTIPGSCLVQAWCDYHNYFVFYHYFQATKWAYFHAQQMLILMLGTVSHISHDYRDDQLQRVGCKNVTKHVMVASTVWILIFDHRARDANMILFQSEYVMTTSVTICRTDHNDPIQRQSDWPSGWLLWHHQACHGHTNCLSITSN